MNTKLILPQIRHTTGSGIVYVNTVAVHTGMYLQYILMWQYRAVDGAGAGANLWKKVEINNIGSASNTAINCLTHLIQF